MGGKVEEVFWAALSGSKSDVQPYSPSQKLEPSEEERMMYKLFHVYEDETGKIQTEEIAERPLRRHMLLDHDTFILELYNKIYVW